MVNACHLDGKWSARKARKRNKVKIGEDPWIGCFLENFIVFVPLIEALRDIGIYSLEDPKSQDDIVKWI